MTENTDSSPPAVQLSAEQAKIVMLEEEVARLVKVNNALMDRVERSNDMQGSAFSLFEAAISLEALVKEHTASLERALSNLAKVNAELAEANKVADAARVRLRDAIESIDEGFALFDANDRLILCNTAYRNMWPVVAAALEEGDPTFQEIIDLVANSEGMLGTSTAPDRWASERLVQHSLADAAHVHALANGRWIQINELRTSEGGIVGIYTDITKVKADDARARAKELADRNLTLQALLDNLTEGVCLFDPKRNLTVWNDALHNLLGLGHHLGSHQISHTEFSTICRNKIVLEDDTFLDWDAAQTSAAGAPHRCQAKGRIYEIRTLPLQAGGLVISFDDVTDTLEARALLEQTAEALELRVQERTTDLITLNDRLLNEISDRRSIEKQLVSAKMAAERANQSKTRFIAAASHDLLQPLNASRLFVSALLNRRIALSTRALVNQTATALDSVEDLLEALLEISRLDAGAIQPEMKDFQINKLLATLQNEFLPLAERSGLRLDIDRSEYWINTDVRLLRRILQNLISNAIRYTETGSVTVSCWPTDGGLLMVDVIDTGIGILPEEHSRIFEEFRRLDDSKAIPGKGLGLAIVQRACETLGYEIKLESELGHGAKFSLAVPLGIRQDTPAPEDAPTGRDRSLRNLNILVIDNEVQIQVGMSQLLATWGCTTVCASDLRSAISQASGLRPDVIIADYHLEANQTGDQIIRELHELFGNDIGAFVISADRSEAVHKALAMHKIPLLNKPVKPAQLRALLTQML